MIDLKKVEIITGMKVFIPGGDPKVRNALEIIRNIPTYKLEIRVGKNNAFEKEKEITANDFCGTATFNGRSVVQEMTVNCSQPIQGQYISIQLINPNETLSLMISEVIWFTKDTNTNAMVLASGTSTSDSDILTRGRTFIL